MTPVHHKDLTFERLPTGGVLVGIRYGEGLPVQYRIPSTDWVKIVAGVALSGDAQYVHDIVKAVHG